MEREDFMKYTGKSKLPYACRVLGVIGKGDRIPEDKYEKGDVWLVCPDSRGMFVVFFDGTQFRLPMYPNADGGCDRNGETQYMIENEFISMFTNIAAV